MRKKRTTVDRQAVIEALKRGEYPDVIAKRLGYAKTTVQKIKQQEGIVLPDRRGGFCRWNKDETIERHRAIREYVSNGHSRAEVAEKFGLSKLTVEKLCRGIGNTSGKINQWTIPGLDMSRFAIKYLDGTDFEYVGGYKNVESKITIRCKKCGCVFERSMGSLRHNYNTQCPGCEQIKRQEKLAERLRKKAERHAASVARAEARSEEAKRINREARRHNCPVCGVSTTRPKYCSKECCLKANRPVYNAERSAVHEAKRRALINSQIKDRDISLKKLYARDKGMCWICGMQCNYSDKTTKGKTIIAGNLYPSIDHIIPLCEGGEHSWKNVKLAHRICNTMRYCTSPRSRKVS